MKLSKLVLALSLAAALGLGAPPAVSAQADHSGHDMGGMAASEGAASPAAQGYRQAMDTMHKAMSEMSYSGDADIDFVRGMIPHHQAAIDMAKVVLVHGKNAEIRKLAEEIIAAQEMEIALMEAWLKAHANP